MNRPTRTQKKLFSSHKIKAEDSAVSERFEDTAEAEVAKLKKLKRGTPDYDKAYISSQKMLHETFLAEIDNTLLPNAKNAELKAMLEKTRETVAKHLEEAKSISAGL